ncbi:MAG: hypothetical protein GYA51_05660 [Candidatus Methanofastidiosa archaeon]|jgi:hypothetical protein|nr:hypothetical protein [Candidatus Methanofastidiosa archaeon]
MKKYVLLLSIIMLLSLNIVSAEKTILIDKYHDTDNWWGDPEGTGQFLFGELSSLGFKTKVNNVPITGDTLKSSNILVLWNPNNNLEESEVAALSKFIEDGGSLLILASHEYDMIDPTRDSLNTLLEPYGIRIMKNGTDDPTNRKGCSCTPIIHNFTSHPITKDINSIILYKPASLEVKNSAIAIAKGDNDTFSIGTEPVGGENVVIVAVSEKDKGKVAVIGSPYIFDNGKIGEMQNKEFAKNLFLWLADTVQFPVWPYYLSTVILIFMGYILYLKKSRK